MGKSVANSEAQLRACEFLLSKQCSDGGWGESYLSCQDKVTPVVLHGSPSVCSTAQLIGNMTSMAPGCCLYAHLLQSKGNSQACAPECAVAEMRHAQPQGTDGTGQNAKLYHIQVYSQLQPEQSQVVHTAWAILALIAAGYHNRATKQVTAAVKYLLSRQLPSGDWPQEHITGVFNRNCMITYANYRCVVSLLPA